MSEKLKAEVLAGKMVKMGHVLLVGNQKRHPAAAKVYLVIHVQDTDGKEVPLMMTQDQFEVAKKRAARNPEDVPAKSLLTDLMD